MSNLIGWSALTSTYTSPRSFLRAASTTSGTLGTKTLCLGKRNVALADHGDYTYICVYNDIDAVESEDVAQISVTGYALADSGESFCLVVDPQDDSTPDNSIVLSNRAVAVNESGDLIFHDSTTDIGTPDEEDVVFIASKPLRVVRKGGNWYLAVSGLSGSPIPGMALWLKADAGVLNGSDAPASNTNQVKTWQDQSGNGFHIADNGSTRPVYTTNAVNSRPAIVFDGSTTELAGDVTSSVSNFTMFMVGYYSGTVPINAIKVATAYGSSGAGTLWMGEFSDGKASLSLSSLGNDLYSSVTNSLTPHIWTGKLVSGTTLYGWLDGTSIGNSSASVSDRNGNTLTLGSYAGSLYFQGGICEILIYSSALSDSDRQKVETYLTNKWL